MATTRRSRLSFSDVKRLTNWPDGMVKDYQNIIQDFTSLSNEVITNTDFSTETIGGVVLLMALVADAAASTSEIVIADVGAAPVAYDESYTNLQTNLLNDIKAKHNTLLVDLNNLITQFNVLLANSKTAKQMAS